MNILIKRDPTGPHATPGTLSIDGQYQCRSLEDTVREIIGQPVSAWKIPGKTAIPVGTYEVKLTLSKRFNRIMPQIMNVPGFEGVRIHSGNTDADTEGCILLGTTLAGPDLITHSREAFQALMLKLVWQISNHNPVTITIS